MAPRSSELIRPLFRPKLRPAVTVGVSTFEFDEEVGAGVFDGMWRHLDDDEVCMRRVDKSFTVVWRTDRRVTGACPWRLSHRRVHVTIFKFHNSVDAVALIVAALTPQRSVASRKWKVQYEEFDGLSWSGGDVPRTARSAVLVHRRRVTRQKCVLITGA